MTREQLWTLAETAAKIIDHQLSLTDETAHGALHHIWVKGYCHGAFETIARQNRLDKVETFALITIAFNELLLDQSGEKRLRRALQIQDDELFVQGKTHGADDLSRFLTSTGYQPLSLMNYFAFGMPPPLDQIRPDEEGLALMKHPQKADFETDTSGGSVVVTFHPTKSTYEFTRLVGADDIEKYGPVSLEPTVWHPAGDTGDYSSAEVQRMALSVAQDAARHDRS